MVITSGQVEMPKIQSFTFIKVTWWFNACQVGAELPVDSEDAAIENQSEHGNTLLFVFERG